MTEQLLNESLRILRQFWGMTQSEAADRLGISQSYLSEIENGNKDVTLEVLRKYSEQMNIPMSSLLFFSEKVEGAPRNAKGRVYIAGKVLDVLKRIAPREYGNGST